MKEIADITIKLIDIEDVDFDVVTEFLEDNHINYEIVKTENLRSIDLRSNEEKDIDYWINKGMDQARGIE